MSDKLYDLWRQCVIQLAPLSDQIDRANMLINVFICDVMILHN